MALYKIRIKTCSNELLVNAGTIVCAMDLVTKAYKCSREDIQSIEVCKDIRTVLQSCSWDIKTVLDSCWGSAEEKLEALLEVLPSCLVFHQALLRDIAMSLVCGATGMAGTVAELNSKEVR